MALLCAGEATVQLLLAVAPGGPVLFRPPLILPVESQPRRLASLDVNQDGMRDLAVLHDSGRLLLLLADGVGGFSTRIAPDVFGRNPLVLIADDQNGDGLRDLLIVDQEAAHSLIAY